MPPIRRISIAAALLAAAITASAQDPDAAAKALIARYVATYDVDKLLKEPAVRAQLQAVTGNQLRAVEAALNVNGGVEYIGGALAVSGNAPRQGGQTEAIVCIRPGATPSVHAALLRNGQVSVFTHEKRWDFLTTCIRDWAALARHGRDARFKMPAGVRMVAPG